MRSSAPILFLCVTAAVSMAAEPEAGTPRVHALVLGTAQDGGVPHLGCTRECCEPARRDPGRSHRVASLALIAEAVGGPRKVFLIDATPDLRSQLDSALGGKGRRERPPRLPVDGILLTHAHIGHYTGLMYLGRESMAARGVPVLATESMIRFLSGNGPWKRLVSGGHIELRPMEPGRAIELVPGLTVEPFRVPHRQEESDVVGFLVRGPSRKLVYIPDIDAWERWDTDIARLVESVDAALLDGTFFSPHEVPGRPLDEIPHPLISASMDRLASQVREGHRVVFIHLNHTNPALREGSQERSEVERRGFEIASDGLKLPL